MNIPQPIEASELEAIEQGDMTVKSKGLQQEEPLIFEIGREGKIGVDLPEPTDAEDRLGGLARQGAIGLPDLSEPEVVRHFVRLSQKNYSIDAGLYPLGRAP